MASTNWSLHCEISSSYFQISAVRCLTLSSRFSTYFFFFSRDRTPASLFFSSLEEVFAAYSVSSLKSGLSSAFQSGSSSRRRGCGSGGRRMKLVGESLGSSIYMSKWYMKDKGPIKQFFVYKQIKIYLLLRLHDNAKSRFISQHNTSQVKIWTLFINYLQRIQMCEKRKTGQQERQPTPIFILLKLILRLYLPSTLIKLFQEVVSSMFNPKERLEQIRKNKLVKEDSSAFPAQSPPPLFQNPHSDLPSQQQLLSRLARLQNTVNQLSSELHTSKQVVQSLQRENSQLETKVLKLEYQNSQLKVSNKPSNQKQQDSVRRHSAAVDRGSRSSIGERQDSAIRRTESQFQEAIQESLLPEVEETLQQVKKEPIENILKRKQQNFRALRVDPRQVNGGNKVLRQFAGICKEYGKTIKKPVLVIKMQATDFE